MNVKRKTILFFFILCFFYTVYAESFRVSGVVVKELTETSGSQTLTLDMGEVLYLTVPEERMFLQGIELKIAIPAILAKYAGSVAYSFYDDVSPHPDESIIDYRGTSVHVDTFTNRLNYHLYIPLMQNVSTSEDPYTKNILLPSAHSRSDIFVRFHIVMKGIPDGMFDSTLDVEIKPVFVNKGLLDLSVLYPSLAEENKEEYPFIVFIDESLVDFTDQGILLDTGVHHITLSSEHFRTEVRTFSIEKAKSTSLEIQLQDIAPLLAISAPENTRFFLNGIEHENYSEPIVVTTGIHQLRFSIGDYEIMRTIEVLNGRTYNVGVSFDVAITEE